jgi:hypothetical protein
MMRWLPRSECHRHVDDLLAFAEQGDPTLVDAATLGHLDGCRECRRQAEQLALSVVALRRLGAEAAAAAPSPDVWPRLQGRLARAPARWRWRAPVAGLLVSAALVAVVLAPAAWLRPPDPYIQEVGLEASIFDAQRAAEDRSEAAVLQQQLALRTRPIPHDDPSAATLGVEGTWAGPDGLGLVRLLMAPDAVKPHYE